MEEEQTKTYIRILCEIERTIEEVELDMYEKEQDVEPDDEPDDGQEDELYGGLDDGLCDNESKVIKDDKLLSTINALIVMYSITHKEAKTWLGIVQETLQYREVGGKDGRS